MAKNLSLINILIRLILILAIFSALLFIPAGSLYWLEAWLCLIIALGGFGFITIWSWYKSRDLIQTRAEFRAPEQTGDRFFMLSGLLTALAIFIMSGLDFRFKLTAIPFSIKFIGLMVFSSSFLIYFVTMRANPYLFKQIEIHDDQEVISTGLYGLVRHPMYVGIILMVTSFPIALGTITGVIPAFLFDFLLVKRITLEERLLIQELEGYTEYMKRVKYRLIPKLW